MRRIVTATLLAGVVGLVGCGDAAPAVPPEQLAKMQADEQKQADDAEREMLRQTQPARKKK